MLHLDLFQALIRDLTNHVWVLRLVVAVVGAWRFGIRSRFCLIGSLSSCSQDWESVPYLDSSFTGRDSATGVQ